MAERFFEAAVLDRVHDCILGGEVQLLGFLDPGEQEAAKAILDREKGVAYSLYGGYRGAERKRLAIMPSFYLHEMVDYKIAAIEISWRDDSTRVRHPEVLGSILGLGIERNRIGDIIALEGRCQVLITEDMSDFVLGNLKRVGRMPVEVSLIDPDAVETPALMEKEIRGTVASLRLDAIGALGFGTSRTKLAQDIKEQKVKLNWKPTQDPSAMVKEGDVISIRGRGRVRLEQVSDRTKKGRINIVLKRTI